MCILSTHALSGMIAILWVYIDQLDNSVLTFRGLAKCRSSGIVPKRVRVRERGCARVIVKSKILTCYVGTWRCGLKLKFLTFYVGTWRCGLKLRIEVDNLDV